MKKYGFVLSRALLIFLNISILIAYGYMLFEREHRANTGEILFKLLIITVIAYVAVMLYDSLRNGKDENNDEL